MRSWPMNSSRVRGRMRAASGSAAAPANSPDCLGAVKTCSAPVVRLQREGVLAHLSEEVRAGRYDVAARLEEGDEHRVGRVAVVAVLGYSGPAGCCEGQGGGSHGG